MYAFNALSLFFTALTGIPFSTCCFSSVLSRVIISYSSLYIILWLSIGLLHSTKPFCVSISNPLTSNNKKLIFMFTKRSWKLKSIRTNDNLNATVNLPAQGRFPNQEPIFKPLNIVLRVCFGKEHGAGPTELFPCTRTYKVLSIDQRVTTSRKGIMLETLFPIEPSLQLLYLFIN